MKERGFTLIELVIAMGIVVMLVSVTVPALNNLGRANLRKTARTLSYLVQSTYDSAALEGRIYRIVFNLDESSIRVESTAERLSIAQGSNALVASVSQMDTITRGSELPIGGGVDLSGELEERPALREADAMSGLLGMGKLMGKAAGKSFEPVETEVKVENGVQIMDIWTETMELAESKGEVSLYFFPTGFTQDALIHFSSESGEAYTVKVAALTGRARVYSEYVELD